jgi:hypothetical protein
MPSKTSLGTPADCRRLQEECGIAAMKTTLRTAAAELAHVARLAAAHREPHQRHIAQIEFVQKRLQVGGEGLVVVPDCRLARTSESAAVVSDDAVAGAEKRWHLLLPSGAAQRPAMDQDDGPAGAVIRSTARWPELSSDHDAARPPFSGRMLKSSRCASAQR